MSTELSITSTDLSKTNICGRVCQTKRDTIPPPASAANEEGAVKSYHHHRLKNSRKKSEHWHSDKQFIPLNKKTTSSFSVSSLYFKCIQWSLKCLIAGSRRKVLDLEGAQAFKDMCVIRNKDWCGSGKREPSCCSKFVVKKTCPFSPKIIGHFGLPSYYLFFYK